MTNNKIPFSQEQLNKIFYYDNETGCLLWKINNCAVSRGAVAGYKTSRGKFFVLLAGTPYRLERIVWKMVYGTECRERIFFRDGNPENTRLDNLVVKIVYDTFRKVKKPIAFIKKHKLEEEKNEDNKSF